MWFFRFLGHGSCHFVPRIPPFFGAFGLFMIGSIPPFFGAFGLFMIGSVSSIKSSFENLERV
jgi:hypothetical protein